MQIVSKEKEIFWEIYQFVICWISPESGNE